MASASALLGRSRSSGPESSKRSTPATAKGVEAMRPELDLEILSAGRDAE
jgi:hypothetical protein